MADFQFRLLYRRPASSFRCAGDPLLELGVDLAFAEIGLRQRLERSSEVRVSSISGSANWIS